MKKQPLCQVEFVSCNMAQIAINNNDVNYPPVKKSQIAEFYARLRDANPAPTTELAYSTPFQLLVAVILSAQATDVGVNKATARLFPFAPTPETMLALGEEGLTEYIKIGRAHV
jgi:endonuclease-3